MNFLQALLQGAASQAPMEADIPVTAPRQRSLPMDDPRDAPNELKTNELIPRKGMFGTKGTIRDVIGLLGDAFLVQAGKAPIYAPQREREKLSSAIYDYDMDPAAAADRAAILDPEVGYKMYGDIADRDLQRQRYEAQAAAQQRAQADKGYKIRASFAGTLKDAASYAKGLPTLRAISQKYGLEGDIPDVYDPATVDQLYNWGIDPARAEALQQGDERIEMQKQKTAAQIRQGDERNAIARTRASRPPAGRPAPRTTQSNVDAEVSAAIANGTATPNQRAYWNARLVKGKGSTRREPPPLPPGFVLKKK